MTAIPRSYAALELDRPGKGEPTQWRILTYMLWTILTVVLVVLAVLFVVSARVFPGRKTYGDTQEQGFRPWSGLWKREDADRLR